MGGVSTGRSTWVHERHFGCCRRTMCHYGRRTSGYSTEFQKGKKKEVSSSSRPVSCAERATQLSLLSTSTCASSVQHQDALQACLKQLNPAIEKSDAMLYAPAVQDFPDSCINKVLECYMSELIMVIEEEEVGPQDCIFDFNKKLKLQVDVGASCPPCEIYTLQNITIFLARLKDLLQKMKST